MITEENLLEDAARALKLRVDDLPANLTDPQLEKTLDLASGTVAVKRTRGTLPIPSFKIGRSRRTPLSAVIEFKMSQIKEQYQEK